MGAALLGIVDQQAVEGVKFDIFDARHGFMQHFQPFLNGKHRLYPGGGGDGPAFRPGGAYQPRDLATREPMSLQLFLDFPPYYF